MLLIIGLVLFLLYGALILFYLRSWNKLKEPAPGSSGHHVFVSVIVPARNEARNITRLLDALQQQTLPPQYFEVIIVDDYSNDNTAQVAALHTLKNKTIIQPFSPPETSSKKRSIESGISKAHGELIITTDADCIPGPRWLETLVSFYKKNNAVFIAAPVKFSYEKNLLQIFQALDFMVLQGITAASVSSGFHTMCNGANLAYTRQAFMDVNGFEGIDQIATGDDMLLMYKIWKQYPGHVFYLRHQDAIVTTAAETSWKSFFMQRKRWASKSLVYKDFRIIAVLLLVYAFNLLFIIFLIAGFFTPVYWLHLLWMLVLKTLIELPFMDAVAGFYQEKKLLRYFLMFQPLHILYIVSTGFISQLGRYEWKGRRTK